MSTQHKKPVFIIPQLAFTAQKPGRLRTQQPVVRIRTFFDRILFQKSDLDPVPEPDPDLNKFLSKLHLKFFGDNML
jgi:hypothetical protein